jgi:hypothetical protein
MNLQQFAREMVKLSAEPWIKGIWHSAKKAVEGGEGLARWTVTRPMRVDSKNSKEVAKKILGRAKNMDPYDRALVSRMSRGAMPPDAKLLNRLAKKHDVRELSATKPLMMAAAPVGVIAGVRKGQEQYRKPTYHGPIYNTPQRSAQIYQDPSRLLV